MQKKTKELLTILYIVALIIMIGGSTFAYFDFMKVSKISPKVEVGTAIVDYVMFDAGKPIVINPTTENFLEGMGNLTDETFARVTAQSSNPTEGNQVYYDLYLEIEKNTLSYSTASKTPELIMQIIDHDDKELTWIDGLDYVTVNGVSGFDITTAQGRYYMTKKFPISFTVDNVHLWKAKFIYLNLEESQDGNMEKELDGFIRIERVDENA